MSRFSMKIVAALVAVAATPLAPSFAQTDAAITEQSRIDAAKSFAQKLTEDAATALNNEGASESEKLAAFQVILSEGLALDTIGKFMLGDARKTMTPEQLARYDTVFPPYITRQYAEQFIGIAEQSLTITDAKALGRRDVIVRSQIERKDGSLVNVDWRVRQLRSGDLKAIDIIVSGVSIMLVKREEFTSFIALNSVDALLDQLESEG